MRHLHNEVCVVVRYVWWWNICGDDTCVVVRRVFSWGICLGELYVVMSYMLWWDMFGAEMVESTNFLIKIIDNKVLAPTKYIRSALTSISLPYVSLPSALCLLSLCIWPHDPLARQVISTPFPVVSRLSNQRLHRSNSPCCYFGHFKFAAFEKTRMYSPS